jgi:hypothetical protein
VNWKNGAAQSDAFIIFLRNKAKKASKKQGWKYNLKGREDKVEFEAKAICNLIWRGF